MIPTQPRGEVRNSVSIECHYDTCPGLAWRGPIIDQRVSGGLARYTVTVDDRMSVLTIDPLMEQDEGAYHCTCNGGLRSSGASNLLVHRMYILKVLPTYLLYCLFHMQIHHLLLM